MSDVIEPPRSGSLVTEVGARQAWLFINFSSSESAEETRLYLDTNWSLGGAGFNLDLDELEVGLMALCSLLNKTLAGDAQTQGANLVLAFEDGSELRIDGSGAATTTHDVWWLARRDP